MKLKQIYLCSKCSATSPRWVGQCSECGEWNTMAEEVINVGKAEKALHRPSQSDSWWPAAGEIEK